jgi:hypothetical protein
LTEDQIPLTESLKDCMIRTKPLWDDKIVYELKKGRNVLVVAHANTLRGLVKTIDNIGDEEIQNVQIPTGIPIIYKFKKDIDTGQLISIDDDDGGNSNLVSQVHMKGKFLEKPGLLKEALKLEEGWKVCKFVCLILDCLLCFALTHMNIDSILTRCPYPLSQYLKNKTNNIFLRHVFLDMIL